MKPACKDCRYWVGDGTEGDCRRYPPAKYGIMSVTCFPTTLPEEWCGEFASNETRTITNPNVSPGWQLDETGGAA